MFEESLDTNKFAKGIKGDLTVELFDAKTGKLQEQQKVHNFIAKPAIDYLQWGQRNLFKTGISALNAARDNDYAPFTVFDGIYLSGSTSAEDPGSEQGPPLGHVVGVSSKSLYSGPSTVRGTVNVGLSHATNQYTRWVFDWSTHSANGSIGSIGWARLSAFDSGDAPMAKTIMIQDAVYNVNIGNGFISCTEDYIFKGGNGSNNIVKYDHNFNQISSFNATGLSVVHGLAWDSDSEKLWIIGYVGSVCKLLSYSKEGLLINAPVDVSSLSVGVYVGLAYDGDNLWAASTVNNNKTTMTCISKAGSIVSSFVNNSTGVNAVDVAWDPDNLSLWVRYDLTYGSSRYPYMTTDTHWSTVTTYDVATVNSGLKAVSRSGDVLGFVHHAVPYSPDVATHTIAGQAYYHIGFDYVGGSKFIIGVYNKMFRSKINSLGSRALLPSPITKNDTQTLRVTYQMNYS